MAKREIEWLRLRLIKQNSKMTPAAEKTRVRVEIAIALRMHVREERDNDHHPDDEEDEEGEDYDDDDGGEYDDEYGGEYDDEYQTDAAGYRLAPMFSVGRSATMYGGGRMWSIEQMVAAGFSKNELLAAGWAEGVDKSKLVNNRGEPVNPPSKPRDHNKFTRNEHKLRARMTRRLAQGDFQWDAKTKPVRESSGRVVIKKWTVDELRTAGFDAWELIRRSARWAEEEMRGEGSVGPVFRGGGFTWDELTQTFNDEGSGDLRRTNMWWPEDLGWGKMPSSQAISAAHAAASVWEVV
jgi:hypothetical protein